MVFFQKKIVIFEIQNFNKIQSFTTSFIGKVRDFTSDFWKILKVLLKNILICEIFSFSKFCGLLFVFFIFVLFLTFYFQFCLPVLVKKF